ncbi:MAG: KamA family radical SAM protein [Myxococcota bacterium]|nr:KamA family radical SAM protein [Myxococcota bacterium]
MTDVLTVAERQPDMSRPRSSLPIFSQPATSNDWRQHLIQGAHDVHDLVQRGLVSSTEATTLEAVSQHYKLQISLHYLNLIEPNNPRCPIRLQAIPDARELAIMPWENVDPIGDETHSPVPLIVHRYRGKVLLFPTLLCPMYCRYCFRKSTLNEHTLGYTQHIASALDYIRQSSDVTEVILTGGDPLSLSNGTLRGLLTRLRDIPTVQRIRIHSRFLVTLPQRFDDGLIELLGGPKPAVLVTHFNHARAITPLTKIKVNRLHRQGVYVANQCVLLRGVNDSADTLVELTNRLAQLGIAPYYLHHLDAAPGTQHFRVSLDEGLEIYRLFSARVDPMMKPRYVLDLPGGFGKVQVDGPAARRGTMAGEWHFQSPLSGEWIPWSDPSEAGALAHKSDARF